MTTEKAFTELQKKLAKAEKINKALKERVKHSVRSSGDAYSLFESNILLQDIVKKKTTELETAVKIAEAAAKKGEFLANMSHEIRTPLNGVLGMMYLLGKTTLDAKQKHFLGTATNSAEILLTVINDILDFSKLEADKVELESIEFNPVTLVEETTALLAQSAQTKDVELISLIAPDVPTKMKGDPVRLRQIVTNLLNNAIKFTDEGEVVLDLSYSGGQLQFSISDSGIGISKQQLSKLFTPFNQADNSHSRKYGGTGLGLTICQHLVSAMNGKISVESTPGVGSIFSFKLRLETIEIEKEKLKQPSISENFSQQHILIIERSKTVRHALKNMLINWQVTHISEVDSDYAALAELKNAKKIGKPYHIVILDIATLGMNGLDPNEIIADNEILNEGNLIFLHPIDYQNDSNNDKNIYIRKPVRQSELYNALSTLIGELKYNKKNEPEIKPPVSKKTNEFNQKHVLLVEDNCINQEVAREILCDGGFIDVDICDNGAEAVSAVQKKQYDVVLMDIQMPVLDGLKAAQQIRALGDLKPEFKKLPIIAMTAHATTGDSDKSLKAGMNDHVTKPIQPEHLFKTLAHWLNTDNTTNHETTPEKNTVSDIPNLPGIDTQDGLARLGGNWKVYKRLLLKFSKIHHDDPDKIMRLINENQWQDAKHLAHTLKGSGGNLGALGLHEFAANLEAHCQKENRDEANFQLLKVRACLDEIRSGLQVFTQNSNQEVITKNNFNKSEWKKNLNDLLLALDSDLSKAQSCFELLNSKKVDENIRDTLKKIGDSLDVFDTETAKSITISLIELTKK